MQLEFDFVWAPKVVEFGPVAIMCDTTIDGIPICPLDNDFVDDFIHGDLYV